VLTWVVGRGGLLGRHIEAALVDSGMTTGVWRPRRSIRWTDPIRAISDLDAETSRFLDAAADTHGGWRLLWCAGSGVIATPEEKLVEETSLVSRFLSTFADSLLDHGSLASHGTVFFASSAGGVYATSRASPPFDEQSPVGALSPYGREKLIQEELFANLSETAELNVLIGRFSNLYGPGQDTRKPQGLVAHIGIAALRRQPIVIYVPLDTIRDYLFAPDAGRMVVESLARLEARRAAGVSADLLTKIFASEVDTTVAAVLGAWRRVLGHPPLVAFAASPASQLQPPLLSFRSRIWPGVRGQQTQLPLGVDAIRRDQLAWMLKAGDCWSR
jgi:UDP-glucose 4-epimerase